MDDRASLRSYLLIDMRSNYVNYDGLRQGTIVSVHKSNVTLIYSNGQLELFDERLLTEHYKMFYNVEKWRLFYFRCSKLVLETFFLY